MWSRGLRNGVEWATGVAKEGPMARSPRLTRRVPDVDRDDRSTARTASRWVAIVALGSSVACNPAPPAFDVEVCVNPDGTATPTWSEGIAVAIGTERAKELEAERQPLTPEELAWLQVVRESLPGLAARAREMATWFDLEPFDATVAVGNRGSSDAFGWVPDHIGINLTAVRGTYGPVDDGSVDRITRILAHEYIHLLTYAFYPDHRDRRDTPLNRMLWTMFFEGIGDYISVSPRWYADEGGAYSPVTARTLRRLEPFFVERLEAAVDASPAEEPEIRRGISMGRFDEKWGSLPVALWLHSEARIRGERDALEEMIRAEREGVLPLALRHVSEELRPRLDAVAASTAR